MKIRDGFKFGIGYFIAGGVIRYVEQVLVEKNPKYIGPLKRIAAALKKEEIAAKPTDENTVKNKIGFIIE